MAATKWHSARSSGHGAGAWTRAGVWAGSVGSVAVMMLDPKSHPPDPGPPASLVSGGRLDAQPRSMSPGGCCVNAADRQHVLAAQILHTTRSIHAPTTSCLRILIPIARACAAPRHPILRHVCRHRAVPELRLSPPQTKHKGARSHRHTHPPARQDTQRAQQQRHSQLLCDHRHPRHQHHRAAHLLEEAGRGRRWRLRQDVSVDQLQHRQLPRGASSTQASAAVQR